MISFITGIPLKLWTYAAIFFGAIGLVSAIYKAGGDRKDLKNIKATLNAAKRRNDNEDNVGNASDDDVREQLRANDWVR